MDTHRRVWEAHGEAVMTTDAEIGSPEPCADRREKLDEQQTEAYHLDGQMLRAACQTVPTTIAGATAMLTYLTEVHNRGEGDFITAPDIYRTLIAAIERGLAA